MRRVVCCCWCEWPWDAGRRLAADTPPAGRPDGLWRDEGVLVRLPTPFNRPSGKARLGLFIFSGDAGAPTPMPRLTLLTVGCW